MPVGPRRAAAAGDGGVAAVAAVAARGRGRARALVRADGRAPVQRAQDAAAGMQPRTQHDSRNVTRTPRRRAAIRTATTEVKQQHQHQRQTNNKPTTRRSNQTKAPSHHRAGARAQRVPRGGARVAADERDVEHVHARRGRAARPLAAERRRQLCGARGEESRERRGWLARVRRTTTTSHRLVVLVRSVAVVLDASQTRCLLLWTTSRIPRVHRRPPRERPPTRPPPRKRNEGAGDPVGERCLSSLSRPLPQFSLKMCRRGVEAWRVFVMQWNECNVMYSSVCCARASRGVEARVLRALDGGRGVRVHDALARVRAARRAARFPRGARLTVFSSSWRSGPRSSFCFPATPLDCLAARHDAPAVRSLPSGEQGSGSSLPEW